MKKLFNFLLILGVILVVSCNNKKDKEEEEVLPTFLKTNQDYSSSVGYDTYTINNQKVSFTKYSNPTASVSISFENVGNKTGTFIVTYASYSFSQGATSITAGVPIDPKTMDYVSKNVGTITITKNTSNYLQGEYNINIYKGSSTFNLTGSFSGRKN